MYTSTRLSGQVHANPIFTPGKAAASRLRDDFIDSRWCYQLRLSKPFAARTIKQDGVPVGFPNCGQAQRTRAVQTKVHPTRFAAANENPFIKWK